MVLLLFPDQHETVIQKLQDPWLQFNYLQQLMAAKHGHGSSATASSHVTDLLEQSGADVTPDMHKLYVKLLCQFDKASVITYLKSNDQYPIDDCLRLCNKYNVDEARAYVKSCACWLYTCWLYTCWLYTCWLYSLCTFQYRQHCEKTSL